MTRTLIRLLNQAASLSADEQLELATRLIEQARKKPATPRRKRGDVIGAAPYPLAGEDAQAWVTRTRQGEEENRNHESQEVPERNDKQ